MKESQVDLFILFQTSLMTGDISNSTYYLRGYEAIDYEIYLIKQNLSDEIEFKKMKNEINLLKETDIKWVNYNIFLIETKSLKNYKKMLKISILLGLLAAILEITISYVFKSYELDIKKTN